MGEPADYKVISPMNGRTYLLKVSSLFLLILKGSSTKSQLAVFVVVGSLSFGIICQPYLLMKIWFCERLAFQRPGTGVVLYILSVINLVALVYGLFVNLL